jgi:hypothetical protein
MARSEILPAITLEVEPSAAGLRGMSEQLAAFARDHELPGSVASRMVSVAADVANVVTGALSAPPISHLLADADIGLDDAQLVLIAEDHRLPELFASLRPRLHRAAIRCDGFAAELAPHAELQVWARFRLAR